MNITKITEPWFEWRSTEQNKLLQPACRDLSEGLKWHANGDLIRLSEDEWRWLVCADILGQRTVRGIHGGVVMLGGSSRHLRKAECTDAITLIFSIGDAPWDYGLNDQQQVTWCDVVKAARGIRTSDDELAQRFAA